jgi:hypothetical protein
MQKLAHLIREHNLIEEAKEFMLFLALLGMIYLNLILWSIE